jgi:hypothetical protein
MNTPQIAQQKSENCRRIKTQNQTDYLSISLEGVWYQEVILVSSNYSDFHLAFLSHIQFRYRDS